VISKEAGFHSCQIPLSLEPLTCLLTSKKNQEKQTLNQTKTILNHTQNHFIKPKIKNKNHHNIVIFYIPSEQKPLN